MVLGERLAQELKELYTKLNNAGKLLSKAQLEGYYETFRTRFGPDEPKSSDQEVKQEGFRDFWTISAKKGLDLHKLRSENPLLPQIPGSTSPRRLPAAAETGLSSAAAWQGR